jgi:hypothetical protein
MSVIELPIRVEVKTGNRLTPRGNDYEGSVWCDGAADTLLPSTRRKHAEKITDLREKKAVLASKRPARKENA